MKNQIFYRLIQLILTLFGVTLISFAIVYFSPIDPVRAMFAASGNIPSEEVMEAMRQEWGLHRPFWTQYGDWLWNCLHGDFGTSFSQGAPVSKILMARLWPTIELTLYSLLFMVMMAVPLGVLSALYHNKLADYIIRAISFVAISMPNFWFGLLMLYFVALELGLISVVSTKVDFEKLFLPAFTLAFTMAGKYSRQVRAAILEEINQDYVIGAKALGLSKRQILWKHIMPNAMLPLITLFGLSIGSLLGGTAVVEIIFSVPALGSLAISAITSMDYPVIQAYVLWIALIYMSVNFIVDISYEYLDPRLRLKRLS